MSPPPAAVAAPDRPARLLGADALRAVATVAVVVIHAAAWPTVGVGRGVGPYLDVGLVARFSVPAFVLLTGLVLAHNYQPRGTGRRVLGADYVRRRLTRTLVPWLVWAPVYFVFDWLTYQIGHNPGSAAEWWEQGGGHLYFLLLVPQFYLLFMIWPRGHRWSWAIAAVVVQAMLGAVRLYSNVPSAAWDAATLWYGFLLFPYWIGYFAVGVAIGGELALRRPVISASLAAIVAVIGTLMLLAEPWHDANNAAYGDGTGSFLVPWMIPVVLGVAAAVLIVGPSILRTSHRVRRVVGAISAASLGVYILHPLLIDSAARLIGKDRFEAAMAWPVVFVAVVMIALLLAMGLTSWLKSGFLGGFLAASLGATRPQTRALASAHPHGQAYGDGSTKQLTQLKDDNLDKEAS